MKKILSPLRPAFYFLLRTFKIRRVIDAKTYVGTIEESGKIQFELLKREGIQPSAHVLEYGCGYLHLGSVLLNFLEESHYVGVDPNDWLRNLAIRKDKLEGLIEDKKPLFLSNDTFDASGSGRVFDYIFSHSVLSHAAHWQLKQYLENALAVLAPGGTIIASIRFAEGNEYGSLGNAGEDSLCEEWQYPGGSYFKIDTIAETAKSLGLTMTHKPEYTAYYTQKRPAECHDWVIFKRETENP